MKLFLIGLSAILVLIGVFLLKSTSVKSTEVGSALSKPSLMNRAEILSSLHDDYNSGNLDGVIEKANTVLATNKDDIEALIAIATTYAMKGSVGFTELDSGNKALEYANLVLELDPNNSEAYRIKGYALEIQERYDLAQKHYEKAVELNPNNYQAWSNMGHAYDLQGDFKKAEKFYLKSLDIFPKGEHVLLNLARLRFRQKKGPETKDIIETLLSITTNNRLKAEAYQMLAELQVVEGDFESANKFIEQSINSDPNVPQAWVTRGRLEFRSTYGMLEPEKRSNAFKNGCEYANKALSLNINQASAYLLLSDLMILSGDLQKRKEYRDLCLQAIDKDITLGQREKESLRILLSIKEAVPKK